MFNAARLTLTLWYVAILAAIVGLLSLVLYRILVTLQRAEVQSLGPSVRSDVAGLFARDEGSIALQLLALDAGVLILAVLGAYVLAGRTLAPIEQSMERQQRFAAAASHELRTPLTVLQGGLEVALLNRRTPEEYERILREAAAEAARMGVLVADLLSLARAQCDADALCVELIDLRDIVRVVVGGIGPAAEHKRQMLDVRLDQPLLVVGDLRKLRQVVSNLLDNAVNYTPEGGSVRITGSSDHGLIRLQIHDNGPGIAGEHLPHIFEPFYRAPHAPDSGAGHTGLGLPLAVSIVRAHGGQITVDSHLGEGSLFSITLPEAP